MELLYRFYMSLSKRAAPLQSNILQRVEDVINMVDDMVDKWEITGN